MPTSKAAGTTGSRRTTAPRRRSRVLDAETPLGPARLHVTNPSGAGSPVGRLVLGHGAGGGVDAADLAAVAREATGAGWQVVRFEQPWRVAGRRVATAPAQLDRAWTAVLTDPPAGLPDVDGPVVFGGRSAGARVACRTAVPLGAAAVCCLAFPLHPPGRPERSRAEELAGSGVPTLVVQGRRDPFGRPEEVAALRLRHVELAPVDGDHGPGDLAQVTDAVIGWLSRLAP